MTTIAICSSVDKNCKVISVEANPLLNNSLNITKARNCFNNLYIVSAAIDYSDNDFIRFYQDDRNLGSHKSDDLQAVKVPTVKLSEIKKEYSLVDYCLVSDIEGAELEMFCLENDEETIEGCKQIIIELHNALFNGIKYQPSDISILITEKFKMNIKYNFQNTWVFEQN
ncbi:MAG: FkbM family methyltransferase [Segetibacter sp.]